MGVTVDGIGADPDRFAQTVAPKLIANNITTRAALETEIDALIDASFPSATAQVRARWKFVLKALFDMLVLQNE